ncbi:Ribosomal protein S18 acetylase RimI [Anaeromicropila populeti]|uniref:Ribosomal protein S18 acetylase RimI n=2 Tax=Anaeromicropila populeti TaxID=37658 RepID=A0A1I6LNZ0_9FIRM|nr:Ribosomal protein S18 acetylase RimI [Anaeromicropila populeti]
MIIDIRQAEEKDCDSVLRIAGEVQEYHRQYRPETFARVQPYSKEFYKLMLSEENTYVFVARDELDQVHGYSIVTVNNYTNLIMLKKRHILMVDDFCVETAYKRQGIGKKLFRFIIDFSKEQKADAIELNVWHFNKEAIAFYQKMGMKEKSHEFELFLAKDEEGEKEK